MRVKLFYHSLISDWNHGNAHFLRGIATELIGRGARVDIYEPANSWSAGNLLCDHGASALEEFHKAYPLLTSTRYDPDDFDLNQALAGADLVLVHEWNEPELVERIGRIRATGGKFTLFFHDTHHRAVTAPHEMSRFDLDGYDGVLAFGAAIADVYARQGWNDQVHVWHEAADTRIFFPRQCAEKTGDLVWVGNWGDGERTAELEEFLIRPAESLGVKAQIFGVRYPDSALARLRAAGIEYDGWTPNFKVPEHFAAHRVTVHIPRSPYVSALPGIPTIRVFEALACGIPLVSAPWSDAEGLFRDDTDFLMVRNGDGMKKALRDLLSDPGYAADLAANGLETIERRHTCALRVDELLAFHRDHAPVAGSSQEVNH